MYPETRREGKSIVNQKEERFLEENELELT